MIICSKAVLGNVVVTAFGASVMSLFVTLICEFIRHRSVKPALDGTKEMFKGMGNCFCDMITLIAAATVIRGRSSEDRRVSDDLRLVGAYADAWYHHDSCDLRNGNYHDDLHRQQCAQFHDIFTFR